MDHRALLQKGIRDIALLRHTDTTPLIAKNESETVPWLFDFRALMGTPVYLRAFAELFWEKFGERAPFNVCGIETGGIALMASIILLGAERGHTVYGSYVRKSRNRYGALKLIEGQYRTDLPTIFIDDILNSGQTLGKALKALDEAGLTVTDVFTVLTFEKKLWSEIMSRSITFSSLFSLSSFGLTQRESPAPLPTWKTLWRTSEQAPGYHYVVPKSGPILHNGLILSGADDGIFRARHIQDGTEAWKHKVSAVPFRKGIFSTAAVHRNVVYFGAYDGNVYALESATGKEVWVYRDADWVGSSPALAHDLGLLFIGLEYGLWNKRGGIAALDSETGEEKWSVRTMPQFTHGSPVYSARERMVFCGSNDGVLYAYTAKNGSFCWSFATGGSIKGTPTYDMQRRLIIVSSFDKKVYALDAKTGALRWVRELGEALYSGPTITAELCYVGSLDKHVYGLSLDTGEVRWQTATHGRVFCAPVLIEGSLFIGSNDGQLYELDPETGKRRSFFQTAERIVNPPAYDSNLKILIVGTQANQLIALQRDK